MTTDRGTVVEVSTTRLGDELAAAVLVGATTLVVVDAADFHEDGGSLTIGGEVHDYLTVDDETGTITLATPLAAGYDAEERVDLHPESVEKYAQVMLGDFDEAVQTTVPHTLWDRVPDGVRDEGAGEVVAVQLVGTEYVLADVEGSAPTVDGTYIDPDTIPANEQLAADLAQLQTDLAQLDTDLTAAQTTLGQLDTDLHGTGGLSEQLAALDTELSGTQSQVGQLSTDLGALDTELSAVLPITAEKIADGAVVNAKIGPSAVWSGNISNGQVVATKIGANAVIAGKIATDAVTANTVAANAIVAGKIATDAVTANTIAAGAVVAGKIAADAVTANTIAAGAITTAKLSAGAVTANEIGAGAITTAKLTAGAVTATELGAGAVVAAKIGAGAITAEKIAAGAITAEKITADALNGKTITGALFQTAATGRRIALNDNPNAHQLSFWSGFETGATFQDQQSRAGSLMVDSYVLNNTYDALLRLTTPDAGTDASGWSASTSMTLEAYDNPAGAGTTRRLRSAVFHTDIFEIAALPDSVAGNRDIYAYEHDLTAKTLTSLGGMWSNTLGVTGRTDTGSLAIGANGRNINVFRFGKFNLTTNGSGEVTVNHALGVVPVAFLVQVSNATPTVTVYPQEGTMGTQNVTCTVRPKTSNTASGSGVTVDAFFIAIA